MEKNIPIDVVIAWVDGNDPAHKEKIQPYLEQQANRNDDIAGATRYMSNREINFCLASIYRYAPFVRRIFIVTDGQDPQLDTFVQKNFPQQSIPIEIVDHTTLFRGYEQYLPTFNSLTIETALHRIPGLSEHFVYFNDDFLLLNPVAPNDWFKGGQSMVNGKWRSLRMAEWVARFKPKKSGHKPFGFKDSMRNAAYLLGIRNRYFHISHTPHPMIKSVLDDYFRQHPEAFEANITHKFRYPTQFNTQALYYLLAIQTGKGIIRREKELYLKPVNRGDKYVKRKMHAYEQKGSRYVCIQSLDQANEHDRSLITRWLTQTMEITL